MKWREAAVESGHRFTSCAYARPCVPQLFEILRFDFVLQSAPAWIMLFWKPNFAARGARQPELRQLALPTVFYPIGYASMHASRCAVCFRKFVLLSEAATSLLNAGLWTDRWQSPAWLIAHHACPRECGASLHEQTPLLASTAPCRHACRAWLARLFFSPASFTPSV
jgi:hypothetical protein